MIKQDNETLGFRFNEDPTVTTTIIRPNLNSDRKSNY